MAEYDQESEDKISYFGGVEEHGNQFDVWKRGKFLALSNFKNRFLCRGASAEGESQQG